MHAKEKTTDLYKRKKIIKFINERRQLTCVTEENWNMQERRQLMYVKEKTMIYDLLREQSLNLFKREDNWHM